MAHRTHGASVYTVLLVYLNCRYSFSSADCTPIRWRLKGADAVTVDKGVVEPAYGACRPRLPLFDRTFVNMSQDTAQENVIGQAGGAFWSRFRCPDDEEEDEVKEEEAVQDPLPTNRAPPVKRPFESDESEDEYDVGVRLFARYMCPGNVSSCTHQLHATFMYAHI